MRGTARVVGCSGTSDEATHQTCVMQRDGEPPTALAELRRSGALTDAEAEKARILGT